MEQKLICPHCNRKIGLILTKEVWIIEPMCIGSKGELYAPRGRFEIIETELKEKVDFLLKSWATKVNVYNLTGKLIKSFTSPTIV